MVALPPLGYTSINDKVPMPKADSPVRRSRLALCRLSAVILELGMGRLVILSLERR